MGDLTKNFSRWEFQCPCDKCSTIATALENARFVQRLQNVRDVVGPMTINSGFRCPEHNKAVGGSPTSSHLKGLAVDISTVSKSVARSQSKHRFKLLVELLKYFNRIGIGKDFIHVDVDPDKEEEVAWLY